MCTEGRGARRRGRDSSLTACVSDGSNLSGRVSASGPKAPLKTVRFGAANFRAACNPPGPVRTMDGTHHRRPSRASVARYGQPREKRSVCGEPAGYELGEEPHALRLACLPLREKPERSVHVQVCARHPRQQRVGISNEAWQRRDPEPLLHSRDLRRGVRDPEWNPRGTNLTLAGPIRNAMRAYDDPPDGIRRAPTPCI